MSGTVEKGRGSGPNRQMLRRALALMGGNWFDHPAREMTMVGVTGTSGKTTSTYLIKSILEQKAGAKVGLVGTIQNMIGDQVLHTERTTPESFELHRLFRQMSDAGCTHVVMEVSSHALSLDRVYGIRFAIGIFTNLSQDHLDFHHTMEEYCDAKSILFDRCDVAIYNADDPWHERLLAHCPCRTFSYSAKGEADLSAKNIQLHAGSVDYDAQADTEWAHVHVGIPAIFTVYNTLESLKPKTGDDSNLMLWTMLGLSALLCAGGVGILMYKKSRNAG